MQKSKIAEKIGTVAINQEVVCVIYRDSVQVPRNNKAEPAGWNWGAFLLTWVWGIGNKVPRALLGLVPFPPAWPVIAVWLGLNGNRLAWEAKTWDQPEHFEDVQSAWSSLGVVVYGAAGAIVAVMAMTGLFAGGRPQSQLDLTVGQHVAAASAPLLLGRQATRPSASSFIVNLPVGWEAAEPSIRTLEAYPKNHGEDASRTALELTQSDNPSQDTPASIESKALGAGGILLGEKDISTPLISRRIFSFKFISDEGYVQYRQYFIAADRQITVTGVSYAPENQWTTLEALFEKTFLSVQFK